MDYEGTLGVAAQWGEGQTMLRYAMMIPMPDKDFREEAILHCKQALRQWYFERQKRKVA